MLGDGDGDRAVLVGEAGHRDALRVDGCFVHGGERRVAHVEPDGEYGLHEATFGRSGSFGGIVVHMAQSAHHHLLSPGRIGSLELRNRIVMCPMGMLLGNDDGTVSDNEAAFYEARARGGAGLLIVGTVCVGYPEGTNHPRMPGASDDRFLPGMQRLAEGVHRHGAKLAAQLNYMGTYSFIDLEQGRPRLVPYRMADAHPEPLAMMMTPQEMGLMAAPFVAPGANYEYRIATEDDIHRVVGLYASAADRCRRAGYDGVELHAGHGYLIDEFLAPRNVRPDQWGGSVENRARFLLTVIARGPREGRP